MLKNTDLLLKGLHIISWIIFVGLCIDTGGLIVNAVVCIFINPAASAHFWGGLNLNELYQLDQSHFVSLVVLMILVSVLKSIMFYLTLNLFHKKQLNLASPFNEKLGKYIMNLSYLAFGIGLFSYWGNNFSNWLKLMSQNAISTSLDRIQLEGADVWLFMGVILIIFALIFKKGIAIQSDNDLTI